MESRAAAEADNYQALDSRFFIRVFYIFAAFALLSIGISAGGKAVGRSIAMAGHTDDTSLHEIVIGNNVLVVPANAIRFAPARRDGTASRLDLYLRWPDLEGYTDAGRDEFNNAGDTRTILFLSFAEEMMSRDMSGRFEPIYRSLIEEMGNPVPGGLMEYRFTERSGYLDETLVVAQRPGRDPFVARCLSGPSAVDSLAPCERDVHLGEELALTYRFPRALLSDWRKMDAAVLAKASGYLKTGQ